MKYLFTLWGEEGDWANVSPEDMAAMMEPWSEYDRQVTEAGVFIAGEALQPSVTATRIQFGDGADRIVTDGPFAETKEQLGGFYLLECDNLDEALAWAKKVPLEPGGSIEVRPVMDFSGAGS